MNSFNPSNLKNIKSIFAEKTGVELSNRKMKRPLRAAVILVAAIACFLMMTAFTFGFFSSLAGDDLDLSATYDGWGVVSVLVENNSDKEINFQPDLKLMRWSSDEVVLPLSGNAAFNGAKVPARTSMTITVDLSKAYDVEKLEEPLADDWYYLVFTNNHFVFGQDWMCSVDFAEPIITPPAESAPSIEADDKIVQSIAESLQFYFKDISFDPETRKAMDAEYSQVYTELFQRLKGNLVRSVSPFLLVGEPDPGVIFDDSVPFDEQHLLVGEHYSTHDSNFKLLATKEESALVLSAALPLQKYEDTYSYLPLFYIFTYDKSEISSGDDYAFIYGQLLRFADLEKYKVYEDEKHVCYEVGSMIYSDLAEHTESFAGQNVDIRFDEQVWSRVERIYDYYKENMSGLFYYK